MIGGGGGEDSDIVHMRSLKNLTLPKLLGKKVVALTNTIKKCDLPLESNGHLC